jgi:hypothetical protein
MSKVTSRHVSLAALAVASLATAFGVTAARADSFTVYTGYADSLRPSGFFPSPWLGGSNIVSNSSGAQVFDSGAILIVNTGSTALDITGFTVSNFNNGAVYNFANLAIPVGDGGIFTQTFQYNFDTSDNANGTPPGGIYPTSPDTNGSNGIGGCSSSAAAQTGAGITAYCAARQPLVSFTDNSILYSLSDKGHIIDTGNYDFINGSLDGNESINWNVIGSEANRGGTVPEPSTWAMMLLGFVGLGFAGYRTKKGARTAVTA